MTFLSHIYPEYMQTNLYFRLKALCKAETDFHTWHGQHGLPGLALIARSTTLYFLPNTFRRCHLAVLKGAFRNGTGSLFSPLKSI